MLLLLFALAPSTAVPCPLTIPRSYLPTGARVINGRLTIRRLQAPFSSFRGDGLRALNTRLRAVTSGSDGSACCVVTGYAGVDSGSVLCATTFVVPDSGLSTTAAAYDVFRVKLENDLGQSVRLEQLKTETLRTMGNFAYWSGMIAHVDANRLPSYMQSAQAGIEGYLYQVIMIRKDSVWIIRQDAIACSDACVVGWARAFGAPAGLIPYTPAQLSMWCADPRHASWDRSDCAEQGA
jgi:hypothetical protein